MRSQDLADPLSVSTCEQADCAAILAQNPGNSGDGTGAFAIKNGGRSVLKLRIGFVLLVS